MAKKNPIPSRDREFWDRDSHVWYHVVRTNLYKRIWNKSFFPQELRHYQAVLSSSSIQQIDSSALPPTFPTSPSNHLFLSQIFFLQSQLTATPDHYRTVSNHLWEIYLNLTNLPVSPRREMSGPKKGPIAVCCPPKSGEQLPPRVDLNIKTLKQWHRSKESRSLVNYFM